MKTCTKCEIGYAATLECFPPDKRNRDGLQSRCRKCCSMASQKYHKTGKGKAAVKRVNKRYSESENGKIVRKRVDREYYLTLNGYLRHIYHSLKNRCNNPRNRSYSRYGGRGIKCAFESFDTFRNYIVYCLGYNALCKVQGLELHRIDNDSGYGPGNVEFLNPTEHRLKHRIINSGRQ